MHGTIQIHSGRYGRVRGISLVGGLVGLCACTETGDRPGASPMPVVDTPLPTRMPVVEDEHFAGVALVRGGAVLWTRPDPLAPGIRLPLRPHPQGMNRWASQSSAVVVGLHGVEGDYLSPVVGP